MEHRVIEIPGKKYETVFGDRDFEELLEKYISYEAAEYYRDRIKELKEIPVEMLSEIEELIRSRREDNEK